LDPATLLGADSATISIVNTKNGTKGVFVHHHATGKNICPVAALAHRMANLRGMRPSTQISTVCHPPTWTTRVSDRDVAIAVQWGATYDCLMAKGYTLDRVSSHSLRASGAMAMKLSGATDSTIMRIVRWTSLTYLTYIHLQIGALSAGVAWKMSQQFTFQTLGNWRRPKESSPLGHPQPHAAPGSAIQILRGAQ
jgi:hypothetical protein